MNARSEFCLTDYSLQGHRRKEKVADLIGKLAWVGDKVWNTQSPQKPLM